MLQASHPLLSAPKRHILSLWHRRAPVVLTLTKPALKSQRGLPPGSPPPPCSIYSRPLLSELSLSPPIRDGTSAGGHCCHPPSGDQRNRQRAGSTDQGLEAGREWQAGVLGLRRSGSIAPHWGSVSTPGLEPQECAAVWGKKTDPGANVSGCVLCQKAQRAFAARRPASRRI